ncbi:MAG: hypothetical protein OES25_12050 [Acidobacteriota bacterium]|nr:hypothetical protein [Acidobacteriota bacterium]
MRLSGRFVISALLVAGLLPLGTTLAQSGEDDQATTTDNAAPIEQKRPFSLFVAVAVGSADADEIDSSIRTTSVSHTSSILSMDNQDYGRATLGWKFPNDKGSVRLVWNGYNEQEYQLSGAGFQKTIDLSASGATSQPNVIEGANWWTLDIVDGVSTAVRNGPLWSVAADANGDLAAQPEEITYDPMNALTVTSTAPTNLQNRLQTVDLVYGREFGTRRFGSRWFAGLRYYSLEGSVPATAWLLGGDVRAGVGFTDGGATNLLTFYNTSSGVGPTVSMSWDIKFFEEKFKIFVRGQSTLAITNVEVESSPFLTYVFDSSGFLESADGMLTEDRSKSTWSNELDFGLAFAFENGIGLEIAYGIVGMLDAYLLPTNIRIPALEIEQGQGTSAIYNTQDYVLNTVRAELSFQF